MIVRARGRTALTGLLVLLGLWGRAGTSRADEGVLSPYAPVPAGIEALAATPAEEALAARAMRSLETGDADARRRATRELVLAGPAGLRETARRLAKGPVGDAVLLELVEVVAGSDRTDADRLLAVAARSPSLEVRACAARGLGAGRSGAAVDALVTLARDAWPAVRAAALRALFAIDTEASRAARANLPLDANPAVLTLRLRLHRLRADGGAAVAAAGAFAFAASRDPAARIEGLRLVAATAALEHVDVLLAGVAEMGASELDALALRLAWGVPVTGYDVGTQRAAAAEALLTLLARRDVPASTRAALLDLGVDWVAKPLRVAGTAVDTEAHTSLAVALPSVGAPLVEPVVRRLLHDRFEDPAHGVALLGGLEASTARDALGDVVLASPPPSRPVLAAVSGGLRDLGEVGRAEVAHALLAPSAPLAVRTDGLAALVRERADLALPLLVRALDDPESSIAGRAAEVLEQRGEPAARRALEDALVSPPWRAFDTTTLTALAQRADDAAYALLDRLLTEGSPRARQEVLDQIKPPPSALKGPRAIALVRRAMEEPALEFTPMDIAAPLATVDGPAGVRYIREHWRTVSPRSQPVFVRNLGVVADRAALDLALEIAATRPDDDTVLLREIVSVLAGPCAKDPPRTDPFWRRILTRGAAEVVEQAVGRLSRVRHGPLADLLVPILADRSRAERVRIDALLACRGEDGQPPSTLLWSIAGDRLEDDDVRDEAAAVLETRDDAWVRGRALAWLAERVDEPADAVKRIARIAGNGATPGQAHDLLALLDEEIAAHYAEAPYFREREEQAAAAHANRAVALIGGVAATRDAPSLSALAARLFDPRFAQFSSESRRHAAWGRGRGGGPLAALVDPSDAEVLLHQAEDDVNATPSTPVPIEASAIADALTRRAGPEAVREIARALAAARESGRLASFSDLYLVWLMRRVVTPEPNEALRPPTVDDEAALSALDAALARSVPSAGAEEMWAAALRVGTHVRRAEWALAAIAAAEAARLGARTGLADVPPTRRIPKDVPVTRPWLVLRARQDLLEGAAAAAAGKTEEAHDAFRRGVDRASGNPRILRVCARLMTASGFPPAEAQAALARAAEIERRLGESADDDAVSTLAPTVTSR